MLPLPRTLAPIAFAGCLLLPQTAAAIEVGRCNIAEDGMFRTVLLVRLAGKTHIHRAGQDGLTRRVLFNSDAAADWAMARYGAGPAMEIASCADDGRDTVVAAGGKAPLSGGSGTVIGTPTAPESEAPPTGNDSGSGGGSVDDQL